MASSWLGNEALRRNVPVPASIWLSIRSSVQAHTAVDWRCDRSVAELGFGVLDYRLIGIDGGEQLVDPGLSLVEHLLSLEVLIDEGFGADQILLRRDQLRLVLGLLRLGLIECRAERTRIDLGEHVAGLNELTFRKADILQFAVHPHVNRDAVEGLHGAEPGEIIGDVLALRRSGNDRDRGCRGRCCRRRGSAETVPVIRIGGAPQREQDAKPQIFPRHDAHPGPT
jgi:hypothetical protein